MQISGTAIKEAREARDLSQTQLAAATNVSVDTIRRAEKGSAIRVQTLAAIATRLGVTIESLLSADAPAVA